MRATLAATLFVSVCVLSGPAGSAPETSPAPTPKPAAFVRGDDRRQAGEVIELRLRSIELDLERTTLHSDLNLIGALAMSSRDERFGGLSGLVWEAGRGLSAISDRGWRVMGLPDRVSPPPTIDAVRIAPLLGPYGEALSDTGTDAEGVASHQKGGWLVSFEQEHRIWRYPQPGSPAMKVRGAPEWKELQGNSGLEAVATGPNGAVFAIPERSGDLHRPFPVWRRAGEAWETLHLPRSGDFLITDAAVGPDGRLYVLERSLSLLGGFAMRIRRANVAGMADGALLQTEEMALFPVGSGVDNMEGMSFAPGGDGRREARLLVVSDDNFRFFQRTLLVEFVLAY